MPDSLLRNERARDRRGDQRGGPGGEDARALELSFALTFWNPPPCVTGYGVPYREGEDTSELPFDTTSACTLPYGDERLVRGSQNAPRGGVPDPVLPGGGVTMPGPLGAPDLPLASTMEELLWPE